MMRIRSRQSRLPTFTSWFLVLGGGSDCLIPLKAKNVYNICLVSSPVIRNEMEKQYSHHNVAVNSSKPAIGHGGFIFPGFKPQPYL